MEQAFRALGQGPRFLTSYHPPAPKLRDPISAPLDSVILARSPGGLVGSGRDEFWSQGLPNLALLNQAALAVTARNLASLTWDWLKRAFPESADSDDLLLEALLTTLRGFSPHSVSHSQRVSRLAGGLAEELGLSRQELELAASYREVGLLGVELAALGEDGREELILAGRIHDVGKLHIPPGILSKTGPLTEEEFAVVRLHPQIGECMLARFESLHPLLPAVRGHHERWDGGGYPDALAGEGIPLSARLLCLADSYDAMTGRRPYREPFSTAQALHEIVLQSGKQFDPQLSGLFVRMVARSGS